MAGKRCVVFDLDGTLADTSGDLLSAANACFRELGLGDLLGPGDAGTALRGGKAMLRLGFSRVEGFGDAEIEAAYPELLAHYDRDICRETVLYPRTMEAVEALRADGFAVAICTNKPEGLAEKLMLALGVRPAFDSLVGADTLPVRKPDPAPLWEAVAQAGGDPARCLLVGDSDTDFKTSRAAGVPSVLVRFAPDPAAVDGLEPEAWMETMDDILPIARRLLAEGA
ncbi:MAG: HAD-IA family hydrolase [Shimia sp.]